MLQSICTLESQYNFSNIKKKKRYEKICLTLLTAKSESMVTEHDLLCMDKELTPTILAKNTTIAAYMLDLSSSTFKITMLLRWWLPFILYSWRGGCLFNTGDLKSHQCVGASQKLGIVFLGTGFDLFT